MTLSFGHRPQIADDVVPAAVFILSIFSCTVRFWSTAILDAAGTTSRNSSKRFGMSSVCYLPNPAQRVQRAMSVTGKSRHSTPRTSPSIRHRIRHAAARHKANEINAMVADRRA
jgi:hypothetical protein